MELRYLALAGCVFLAACASTGQRFNAIAINQFEQGVTTIADAERLLGSKPQQTILLPNGNSNVYWRYIASNGMNGNTTIQSVGFVFGPDRTLIGTLDFSGVPIDPSVMKRLNPPAGN